MMKTLFCCIFTIQNAIYESKIKSEKSFLMKRSNWIDEASFICLFGLTQLSFGSVFLVITSRAFPFSFQCDNVNFRNILYFSNFGIVFMYFVPFEIKNSNPSFFISFFLVHFQSSSTLKLNSLEKC